MHTKMDRNTKSLGIALVAASALAFGAIGCSATDDDDDDRCDTTAVMFFSTVDRHYHYGSPTGKVVPANKVPSSARKVPGYSAPKPAAKPKTDTGNKPKTDKPKSNGGHGHKSRPAPRSGRR